jgi:hypothetical protein
MVGASTALLLTTTTTLAQVGVPEQFVCNDHYGFSVMLPSDWHVLENSDRAWAFKAIRSDATATLDVHVHAKPRSWAVFYISAQDQFDLIRAKWPGCEIVANQATNLRATYYYEVDCRSSDAVPLASPRVRGCLAARGSLLFDVAVFGGGTTFHERTALDGILGRVLSGLPWTPLDPGVPAELASECGLAFCLPRGWETSLEPSDRGTCTIRVQPFDSFNQLDSEGYQLDDEGFLVTTWRGDSDAALARTGIVLGSSGWSVNRGGGPSGVARICGSNWSGFRASPLARVYSRHGYSGLGDTELAVFIGPAGQTAELSTEGPLDQDVLDLVIQSFEFIAPEVSKH